MRQQILRRGRLRQVPATTLVYVILIGHALLTLFPLLWVFSHSFRMNDAILTSIRLIPETFALDNYYQVLLQTNIPQAFLNSVSITFVTLLILLVTASPLSFALSRFQFRAAGYIFMLFGLAILVPAVSVVPMTFRLFNDLGLLGTKYGICLVYATAQLPVSVFLLVMFLRTIPVELDEAAIVDGCGIWGLFLRVILPLSRNGIVTIVILAFVAIRNDYLTALILLPDEENRTLSLALAAAKDEYRVDYGVMAAAIVFAVVLMLIIYMLIKDRLTSGMAAGAVKG